MRKSILIVFFLGLWVLLLNSNSFADGNSSIPPADTSALSQKLDKIIDTQAEILKELDEVKVELQIVKVRASRG